MMRMFALSTVWILAVSGAASGQTSRDEVVLPPVFMGAVQAIDPPGQAGAWALQVISRGGFEGRGTGDLILRSDGTVSLITAGKATASVQPETLLSIGQRIRTVTTPRWAVDSRLGVCSDCMATLIVLAVRERNGLVQTYTAFWDATTKAAIPADLLRIHELALTIQPR